MKNKLNRKTVTSAKPPISNQVRGFSASQKGPKFSETQTNFFGQKKPQSPLKTVKPYKRGITTTAGSNSNDQTDRYFDGTENLPIKQGIDEESEFIQLFEEVHILKQALKSRTKAEILARL